MMNYSLGVIDANHFPIVYIHGPSLIPGDGSRILQDLETLIRRGKAFVLVIINGDNVARKAPVPPTLNPASSP